MGDNETITKEDGLTPMPHAGINISHLLSEWLPMISAFFQSQKEIQLSWSFFVEKFYSLRRSAMIVVVVVAFAVANVADVDVIIIVIIFEVVVTEEDSDVIVAALVRSCCYRHCRI